MAPSSLRARSVRFGLFSTPLLVASALVACSPAREPENETPPFDSASAEAATTAPAETDEDLLAGRSLIEAGKFADAVAPLEKAVAADPKSASAAYYLGLAYDQSGNKDKAVAEYKAALAINPKLVEPAQNLAAIYLEDPPHPDEAIPLLSAALKVDPTDARTLENLGYAYGLKKDVGKATTAYEAALKIEDKPSVRVAYGAMLLENGKPKEAVVELSKAAEGTDDLPTLVTMATMMGRAEAFDQCAKLFDKAIAKEPNSADLLVRRGSCKHGRGKGSGDEKGASDDFRAAIKLDPKFVPAHYYLGLSLLEQKDRAGAKAEFQKAYELDKDSKIGKLAKAQLDKMK
jgi:Flp pilus assembly protein TadD